MSGRIAAAVGDCRERVAAAALRAGRDPAGVTLVGATKTVPAARIAAALEAGIRDIGENRAQELVAKADQLAPYDPQWHFVGPLQRNKVRALTPWVTCWQTVDRAALGVEIAKRSPRARVLVEVNVAGEAQKAGIEPANARELVDALGELGLEVAGLMTVPPHHDDPRRWFAALRELADRLGLTELSMGMTDDFEIAVEEGATIVRVGRAIFGERR